MVTVDPPLTEILVFAAVVNAAATVSFTVTAVVVPAVTTSAAVVAFVSVLTIKLVKPVKFKGEVVPALTLTPSEELKVAVWTPVTDAAETVVKEPCVLPAEAKSVKVIEFPEPVAVIESPGVNVAPVPLTDAIIDAFPVGAIILVSVVSDLRLYLDNYMILNDIF